MLVFEVGTSSELILDGVTLDMGNTDQPLITNQGEMTLINSQVWGGVISGNVFENSSTLTFQNSTIDTSINNSGELIVDYSTLFAENRPNYYDEGVFSSSGITNTGSVKLNSSILVTANSDCIGIGAGTFEDLGYNLFSNASSCPTTMTTTQTIAPALLFTDVITGLADNGGNTMTYALLSGSPALDVVPRNANDCGVAIVTDQRGIGRPQNALCDIGAYEVINNILPVAVDDTAVTDEEIVVTIDVLANDSDADFDALTVTDVFT
ncbi:MAG: hypothetical protein GY805_21620, partial [Chloroflexi bacterium]|nr:hypothetical protein [Chloroflexota bacterium]